MSTAYPGYPTTTEFFCSYYALEWFIRFMAFEWKCNCLRDGWFVFDSITAEIIGVYCQKLWHVNFQNRHIILMVSSAVLSNSREQRKFLFRHDVLLKLKRAAEIFVVEFSGLSPLTSWCFHQMKYSKIWPRTPFFISFSHFKGRIGGLEPPICCCAMSCSPLTKNSSRWHTLRRLPSYCWRSKFESREIGRFWVLRIWSWFQWCLFFNWECPNPIFALVAVGLVFG